MAEISPLRRRGRRSSVWAPPIQWMRSTISPASVSISAITSWITVRTMRFLSRASVVGADQTALRSSARAASDGSDLKTRRSCGVMLRDLRLDLGDAQERPIPARLQFCRYKAVCGIGRIILAECPVSGIASRLEVT